MSETTAMRIGLLFHRGAADGNRCARADDEQTAEHAGKAKWLGEAEIADQCCDQWFQVGEDGGTGGGNPAQADVEQRRSAGAEDKCAKQRTPEKRLRRRGIACGE